MAANVRRQRTRPWCGCANAFGCTVIRSSRLPLRRDIVAPLERIHEAVSETDTCGEVMTKVFQTTIQALQYTARIVNQQQLEKTVETLDKANRIVIMGMGNSAAVAKDMQHKLLRLGLNATAYDDNHMSRIVCTYLTGGDVCVCISHSGSSRDVVDAAKMAHDNGAKVISMTRRRPLSPVGNGGHPAGNRFAGSAVSHSGAGRSPHRAVYADRFHLYHSGHQRREGKGEYQQDIERALEKLKY